MKNPLIKRLPKELLGEIGKYIVIFLFIAGTIGFVSGFIVAGDSMMAAYNNSFEKYNIEDGNFELSEEADNNLLRKLQQEDISVYNNYYVEEDTDTNLNGRNDSTLRIFMDRTDVNKVCIVEGSLPKENDEIAIDRMYAENNNVKIGDAISVNGTYFNIVGLVALSDYSALFSDNSDMMFDAVQFGVAIVTEDVFFSFGDDNLHYSYSWIYKTAPKSDKDEKEKSDRIALVLGENAVVNKFVPQYVNQAINFTGDDLGGDRSMMITLLYILIAILAFVFAVTTSNTISHEATVIGTLRASGYTKGELVRHYMALPIIVTLMAAVVGNVMGYTCFKNIVADLYYQSYSLVNYDTLWNGDAFLLTTIIPAIIMVAINYIVLRNKLSLSPLKFIRRDLSKNKRKKAIRLPHYSFFNRFRIRNIIQNMPNYITLFIGIVFANVLLLFGLMMIPLLRHYQDKVLDNMVSKYQYILKAPVDTTVAGAEQYCVTSLSYKSDKNDGEDISVYGLEDDSDYFNIDFSKNEVYISKGYAEKYSIRVGDSITLCDTYSDREYTFKISGTIDYPSSLAIFMSSEKYIDVFEKEGGYFNGYFSDSELTDVDDRYISNIVTEDDLTKVTRQLDKSMGSMFGMVNVFAVILFIILIYLLTKIIIEKNTNSISMVKILGYENVEINKLYLRSTTWMVVIIILASLPISTFVLKLIYNMMMSKFTGYLEFYINPIIYFEMFFAGIISYLAVALLQMRKIKNIPMDEALKNVE